MNSEWTAVAAEWAGELAFEGANESGGRVRMGVLEKESGIWPMEMLLLGLAGCTGIDVVHVLQQKRQQLMLGRTAKISSSYRLTP